MHRSRLSVNEGAEDLTEVEIIVHGDLIQVAISDASRGFLPYHTRLTRRVQIHS